MSADVGKIETPVAAADILAGFQTFAATTAATTVIQVPAGRTWVGTVSLQCASSEAAAGAVGATATGVVTTAGVGVTPAAGTYLRADAITGANAATGLTGSDANAFTSVPLVVVAPIGNAVQVQCAATITGTAGQVSCTASGVLQ